MLERRDYIRKAENLEKEGKLNEAIDLLKECRKDYPEFLVARLYLARLLYSSKDIEEAKDELEFIISRTPDSLGSLKLLSDIYIEEEEYQKARELLLKAKFLSPFSDDIDEKIENLEDLMGRNIVEDTVKEEIPFTELGEENPEEEVNVGEISPSEGEKISSEVKEVNENIGIKEELQAPSEEEPYFNTETMAIILLKQGEFQKAKEIYEKLAIKGERKYKRKLKLIETIEKLVSFEKKTKELLNV